MDDFWRGIGALTFNSEAEVEQRLVVPLLKAVGYADADIVPKFPVVFQEGRTGRNKEADYVTFAAKPHGESTSLVVVEAKSPREKLRSGYAQAQSYTQNLKAPIYVVTNGLGFEIWMAQIATASELVFSCDVVDLASNKATIDLLLSKAAVKVIKESLRRETIRPVVELSLYVRAELERTSGDAPYVHRGLSTERDNEIIQTDRLLIDYAEGAVVLGASGHGKTALATHLVRQSLQDRELAPDKCLAIDVYLPDLFSQHIPIEQFVLDRIRAQCPVVTAEVLSSILFESGCLLVCDGYDRLDDAAQEWVDGGLKLLKRDKPLTRYFLFSNLEVVPELDLQLVRLAPLDDIDKMRMVDSWTGHEGAGATLLEGMAPVMKRICDAPIALRLAVNEWQKTNKMPVDIAGLFEGWITNILEPYRGRRKKEAIRATMSAIAARTKDGPISQAAVDKLIADGKITKQDLNSLVERSAISKRAEFYELYHEVISDYFRAESLLQGDTVEVEDRLLALAAVEQSFLPAFLMSIAKDQTVRDLVWHHVIRLGIPTACDALIYRGDLTDVLIVKSQEEVSGIYLSDILQTVVSVIKTWFPAAERAIYQNLSRKRKVTDLAIAGMVYDAGGSVGYSFLDRKTVEGDVIVDDLDGLQMTTWHNLKLQNMRLDSGRLLGIEIVRDQVLALIKDRRLAGQQIWLEETVLGRLAYLRKQKKLPVDWAYDLSALKSWLSEQADTQFGVFDKSAPRFSYSSLIEDIDGLLGFGTTHLMQWWHESGRWDIDSESGRDVLIREQDIFYRRVQQVYLEMVTGHFDGLGLLHTKLFPISYQLTVEKLNTGTFHDVGADRTWEPVASIDEVLATTTFGKRGGKFDWNAYIERLTKAYADVGRQGVAPSELFNWGRQVLKTFDSWRNWTGAKTGESPVIAYVAELLTRDVSRLFQALPARSA